MVQITEQKLGEYADNNFEIDLNRFFTVCAGFSLGIEYDTPKGVIVGWNSTVWDEWDKEHRLLFASMATFMIYEQKSLFDEGEELLAKWHVVCGFPMFAPSLLHMDTAALVKATGIDIIYTSNFVGFSKIHQFFSQKFAKIYDRLRNSAIPAIYCGDHLSEPVFTRVRIRFEGEIWNMRYRRDSMWKTYDRENLSCPINYPLLYLRSGEFERDLHRYFGENDNVDDIYAIINLEYRFHDRFMNKKLPAGDNPIRNFMFTGMFAYLLVAAVTVEEVLDVDSATEFYRLSGWPWMSWSANCGLPDLPVKNLELAGLMPTKFEAEQFLTILGSVFYVMDSRCREIVNKNNILGHARDKFKRKLAERKERVFKEISDALLQ